MLVQLQHGHRAGASHNTPLQRDVLLPIRGGAASWCAWHHRVSPLGGGQLHEANARHVEEILEVNAFAVVVLPHLPVVHGGGVIKVHGVRGLVIDIFEAALALGRRGLLGRCCDRRRNDVRGVFSTAKSSTSLSTRRRLCLGRGRLEPHVLDRATLVALEPLHSSHIFGLLVVQLGWSLAQDAPSAADVQTLSSSEDWLLRTQPLYHLPQTEGWLGVVLRTIGLALKDAQIIFPLLLFLSLLVNLGLHDPRIGKRHGTTGLAGHEARSRISDGLSPIKYLCHLG